MRCAKPKLVTLVAILGLCFLTGCIFNRPPLKPANPQPQFDAQNIPLNTVLSWNCSDPDGDQLTYNVYFGTDPNSLQAKTNQISTSYTVNSLDPGTKYYWKIQAIDQYGNDCMGDLWMFTTEVEKNPSPTLNIPNQNVYKGMFSLNLLNYATDSNGDDLSFTLVDGVGSIDGNKYTHNFTKSGQYTVKIKVSDGASVAENEFVITVINRAPTIDIPDQTIVKGQTLQVSLTQYATDPDGDGLTCQKMKGVGNVNENIFTLSTDDNLSIGNYDVKMQVSDGESIAEDVFTITVTESEVDQLTLDLPDQIVEEGQTLQLDLSQYAKDKKGDVLSFVLIAGVGNISGHIFTYSPDYLSAGQYQVKIRTSDGNLFAEDEFNITVNNKPRAPIFDVGDMSINENEPLQIGLSQYASDPDGDTLTFTLVSGVGSVSGNVYSYYPDYTSAGEYKVTIRVSDGSFFTDDSFTITVNNVSRPPQINIPDMTTSGTLTFDLTQYASDPDGDTLNFTLVSGGGNINGNTFTFSFTSWPSGTNNVTIRVSDGVLSAEDSFKITKLPQLPPSFRFNDIPGQNIDEGQTLQLDLTQYAYDSSGKPLTFTVVSGIGNINGNIYTYTADYSSAGQYTVTLRVSNGQTSLDKTFSLTVNNKNRSPQLLIPDQSIQVGSVLSLNLSQYASDQDGDILSFTLVSGVGNVTGNTFTYSPTTGAGTKTNVKIVVSDGILTAEDLFEITVTPQLPTLFFNNIPDQNTDEGQTLQLDLTQYAYDTSGKPLTFTIVSGIGNINGNIYTYTADYSSAGQYTVILRVNNGQMSLDKTFSLTINNKNRPPQFIIPDQATNEGSSLNLDLSQYASDPDGDTLAFTLVSGVGSVSGKIYSYTPDYVSAGQHQVSIGVSDGQSTTNDTFLIMVNNKNRPPQINIPDQTIEEGQVLTIDLTDYASDPDEDPLTFTLVSGSGTIRGNTYQYSADYGSAGLKTIKIRVNDGSTSAEDTFSLTILEAISNVTITVNPFPYGEEIVNTIYTNIWAEIYYTTGDGTYEYYDACQCNDNGIMSLQNVPFGEYVAEFFYDSSIQDLETGSTIEYWGELDFSADSATVNVDFERNAPYLLDMYPWYGERIKLSEQPTATFYNGTFYDAAVKIEFYFSQRSNHSQLYYAEQGEYLDCYFEGSALFYVFGGPVIESCYLGNDVMPDFMIVVKMEYTNPDGTITSVVTNKIPWIPTYVTP